MLKRLYVDNYKALVNFELAFDGHCLLLGGNGSGKSSVFEVLSAIGRIGALGAPVETALPSHDSVATRWQTRSESTFELDLVIGSHTYRYSLRLDTDFLPHVAAESLTRDGMVLFERLGPDATIHTGSQAADVLVADLQRASLSSLSDQTSGYKLRPFRDALLRLTVVHPDPRRMAKNSTSEAIRLDRDLANFASWWRHAWQSESEAMQAALRDVAEVLPGFRSMSIQREEKDETRVLRTRWDAATGAKGHLVYDFDELSDGQRTIIALYSVLHWLGVRGGTLAIDEPDNFVALAEIQPLLRQLLDVENVQLIIASHHPEVLNEMAVRYGRVLRRDKGGPVRIEPYRLPQGSMLTPSERIASHLDELDG